MPRVIAGKFKGYHLLSPKGKQTRPTPDKVKEALFSILQGQMVGARFLDLFSGCGQIGIEAISRGAKEVVFVEQSRKMTELIHSNLLRVCPDEACTLLSFNVHTAIRKLGESATVFDLIYMDPPYEQTSNSFRKIAEGIERYGLLNPGGLLIVEHDSSARLAENVTNLTLSRCCKYGMTLLTFYKRNMNIGGDTRSEDLSISGEL